MFNNKELQDLSEATLLSVGIDPKTKKNVDSHNAEAKKQAEKLLEKFEGLLEVIHDVVKRASKDKLLGNEKTKVTLQAIDNSRPGEHDAEGGVFLERGVKLEVQEKKYGRPITKYIEKHLPDNIDMAIFMKNTAFSATSDISDTIYRLKSTIEGRQCIVSSTKIGIDKGLS